MKELLKNKKIVILSIILFFLILLFVFGIFRLSKNMKDSSSQPISQYNEDYHFTGNVVEVSGTEIIENDQMKADHCLNDICISNAIFYYADGSGRVDYTIHNQSSKTASGYLKMNFGSNSLIVAYQDLRGNESIQTTSQFLDMKFSNVTDYILEELSEEEINQIIVSN